MLAFWRAETRHIDPEKIKFLENERQNLFHAVQIGLRFRETEGDTAVILSQTIPFIAQRGYWRDWIPLLQESLNNASFPDPSCRFYLMIALGQTYRLNSQLDKAIAVHEEALQIAKETDQGSVLPQIQLELLEDYLFSKAFEKAKTMGLTAINLLEQTKGSENSIANGYKMLGLVFYELNDPQTAEDYFLEAIALWRQLGHPVHLARTLNDLSILLLALKRFDEAQDRLNEAASLLAPTINELDKCMIFINLGSVYSAQQKWAGAESAFHQANSPFLRQSVELPRKGRVNNNLGYVLYKQNKYEEAEEFLRLALQIWQETGDEMEYANTLSTLADTLMAQQGPEVALPYYDELLSLLANHPQNKYAQNLLHEYLVIRNQVRQEIT